jgi:molybdopterin/thiamine biosynthesis adenylyltransferase
MNYERIFDRPRLLFGEQGQKRITRLKVAVAGCGVVGTPLAIGMSRLGVAELRTLDRGIVEKVNLANNLFLTRKHVGQKKTEAVAKLAQSWSLRKCKTKSYNFDVTDPNKWNPLISFLAGINIVYGCFDNLPARFSLNSAAIAQNVKYVDLGIEGFSGRIRLIDKTRACYACDPLIPEHFSTTIFSLMKDKKGCDYAPTITTLPTATLTAAHAIIEGLKFLNILENNEKYDYLYFDFLSSVKPVKMQVSKRRDCKICGADGLATWQRQ